MATNISRIALTLGALAVVPQAGAGEFGAKLQGLWRCQNNQASPTATLYVSELFEADAAREEVYAAFKKMLAAKYDITSGVSCSIANKGPGITEKIEADNLRWFKQLRTSGAKVVETGWRFASTAPAAKSVATATPAAPATAPEKAYQCWMNSYGNNFMTPSFTSSREYYALNADWRAYITEAHPPNGPAQIACMETDPKQAANNLADPLRARVDWKE